MLIAEIRRKLLDLDDVPEEGDDGIAKVRELLSTAKEDLLTSDVFGALKYLPRDPYLRAVLAGIAKCSQSHLLAQVVEQLSWDTVYKFSFWPSYPTPAGIPGAVTEPDVELSGPALRIFFEAKLHSGLGKHQVARQLLIGLQQAGSSQFFLVVVTAGLAKPRDLRTVPAPDEIPVEVRRQLQENMDRVLWINWSRLMNCIEAATAEISIGNPALATYCKEIVSDLSELMHMRGLGAFHGIGRSSKHQSPGYAMWGQFLTRQEHRFQGIRHAVRNWRATTPMPWRFRASPATQGIGIRRVIERHSIQIVGWRPFSSRASSS
jgi:hypothetical protein